MYFPYFITYIVLGFAIGLPVLIWALRNGQFRDQQRARFLPLEDEGGMGPGIRVSRMNRYEAYGIMVLAVVGLLSTASVLAYTVWIQ